MNRAENESGKCIKITRFAGESPRLAAGVEKTVLDLAVKEISPFFYYVYVALFAMVGCFARILMDKLFVEVTQIEDSKQIINESFISNITACFILDTKSDAVSFKSRYYFASKRILTGSSLGESKFKALYEGLAIGFCGSLSTWSHWNQQISLVLVNETETVSTNQVMAIFAYFIAFFSFCGSYSLGNDVSALIGKQRLETYPGATTGRSVSHIIITVLLIVAFTAFVLLMLFETQEQSKAIILAPILAPFAACIRKPFKEVWLSKKRLPLGTLIVNVVGVVLVATLHVLKTRLSPYSSCKDAEMCWPTIVIFAFEVGFCGTLTTVSDITGEFFEIQKRKQKFYSYLYIILTLSMSQLLAGVINGINYSYL